MAPLTGKGLTLDLAGEDGNAWVIMAQVGRIIEQVLGSEDKAEYMKRAMSGNYENLLAVSNEYVTIIDAPSHTVIDL